MTIVPVLNCMRMSSDPGRDGFKSALEQCRNAKQWNYKAHLRYHGADPTFILCELWPQMSFVLFCFVMPGVA